MQNINSDANLQVQLAKAAYTTDQTPSVELGTANHIAKGIVIDVGAWTDGTHTFDVEESDDASTWTSVDAADLSQAAPVIDSASDDEQQYYLDYTGTARYLRAVVVVTGGASTGAVYGIYGLATNAKEAPVR